MFEASVNEFPFMVTLAKREKSRFTKFLDHYNEFKTLQDRVGDLLPLGIVHRLLNVSRQRVSQLREAGKLEAYEWQGQWWYTEDSVIAFAKSERRTGRPGWTMQQALEAAQEIVAESKRKKS